MKGWLEKAADKDQLLSSFVRIREKYYDDCFQSYRPYASGADGEDLKDFELHLDRRINDCRRHLLEALPFDPQISRRVPKDSPGEFRRVYLLTLRDKVVQKSIADVLSPELEKIYAPNLYSYRPATRFGNRTAAAWVLRYLKEHEGRVYAFKTDISDYSDHLLHDRLRQLWLRLIPPRETKLIRILENFLHQPKLENGALVSPVIGIPSGSPLTPLFNNLYLADLDKDMFRRGIDYRRFGDDILVLSTSREKVEEEADHIRSVLKSSGLPVSENKTRVASPGETFEYLGYRFEKNSVHVAAKSLKKYRDWIRTQLTRTRYRAYPKRTAQERRRLLKKVLSDLNAASDRGLFQLPWLKTFPLLSSDRDLREMDRFIKERIRLCVLGRPTKRAPQDIPEGWFRELGYKSLAGAYYRISRRRTLGPYFGWRIHFGTNFEKEAENHRPPSPLQNAWRRFTESVQFVRKALEGSAISDTKRTS